MKDIIEDNPYTRIEIRILEYLNLNRQKQNLGRNPQTNEEIYVPAHKKLIQTWEVIKAYLRRPI